MYLDEDVFSLIVANTPLVSIDLIVLNEKKQILLGKRINKPAQNHWFVPGGRILKDETLAQAFKRLTRIELGNEIDITQAVLLGPYEHFYPDNFYNEEYSTHYIALGYQLSLELSLLQLPKRQHAHYQWFDGNELLSRDDVHLHTKWYFA
ncbi:GDP-mannose mannosyl hydrolase [Shewanella psychropiezotolerans]|uniref:GDP-mannose mannosyl hydrolase n=1 Tax=Shewanella psychropiezotolerans TaxID=2593655 RepID=A0ABX5WWP2_9GAMM|nr:GDP-mannose mannosyl hydrolase [Shewanella psychropiezotolerans]QDO83500.1 GDP-mannose mannosyl hydrolase [Shewanella psychropiezotolerans]